MNRTRHSYFHDRNVDVTSVARLRMFFPPKFLFNDAPPPIAPSLMFPLLLLFANIGLSFLYRILSKLRLVCLVPVELWRL